MTFEKLLPKDLEIINRYLGDYYGFMEGSQLYRLIWSDDQFEKRWTSHTRDGLQLLLPMVVELPKYKQWAAERYIIEKLCVKPEFAETDLVEKLSYEPLYVFEKKVDGKWQPVRPNFPACRFVLETVKEAIRSAGSNKNPKYRDPDSSPEEAIEDKKQRIAGLREELFGNESDITDALSVGEGVAYGRGSSPNSSTPLFKPE